MYNVKIDSIKKVNSLTSDMIYINQKIKIPSELNVGNKEFITINNQKYYINKKEVTYNHVVRRYDNWYKIARKV
jgi:LysM repeat protein